MAKGYFFGIEPKPREKPNLSALFKSSLDYGKWFDEDKDCSKSRKKGKKKGKKYKQSLDRFLDDYEDFVKHEEVTGDD